MKYRFLLLHNKLPQHLGYGETQRQEWLDSWGSGIIWVLVYSHVRYLGLGWLEDQDCWVEDPQVASPRGLASSHTAASAQLAQGSKDSVPENKAQTSSLLWPSLGSHIASFFPCFIGLNGYKPSQGTDPPS